LRPPLAHSSFDLARPPGGADVGGPPTTDAVDVVGCVVERPTTTENVDETTVAPVKSCPTSITRTVSGVLIFDRVDRDAGDDPAAIASPPRSRRMPLRLWSSTYARISSPSKTIRQDVRLLGARGGDGRGDGRSPRADGLALSERRCAP
jgi:hypothetical protein